MRYIGSAVIIAASVLASDPAQADGYLALPGSEWGEGSDTGPSSVMVKFEQGNKVWGRLGCNRFTGTYTHENEALRFGTFATTRMACPEAQMKTEKRVGDALMATRKADVSHLKLILQDESGKELLILQRRDAD
jgi:heat shock protein HslJ